MNSVNFPVFGYIERRQILLDFLRLRIIVQEAREDECHKIAIYIIIDSEPRVNGEKISDRSLDVRPSTRGNEEGG